MKKILIFVLTFLAIPFSKLSAVGVIPNPSRINSLEELINLLAGLIRPVFLVTFIAMLLYGAFMYTTAGDSPDKVKTARSIIIAAIIGFAIAVFAPGIVSIVSNFLGVSTSL